MATVLRPNPSVTGERLRGVNLLSRPILSKSTAFTEEERTRLGLDGLLPPHVESLD